MHMNSFGGYGDRDGRFTKPTDIAQDGAGNLYVTDTNNDRVQVFDCKGRFLSTFSRKEAASKRLDCPYGICVGSDQLVYVCDKNNNCVSVFQTSGEFVTSFGELSSPGGIVIDEDGFVYVSNFAGVGKIVVL